MPGARDEKLIADKYALDYPRRPLATRIWKSRWNWLALFLSAVVALLLFALWGDSAFWSGPVSDVHASFAMDCSKCHTDAWQPVLRLTSVDSSRHSVPNSACQECHQAGDHHPRVGEQELACAACHQEHRAERKLTEIADNQCVRCHGDLIKSSAEELSFAAEIRHFGEGEFGHPEFAILRTGGPLPGVKHGVWQVAQPTTDGENQKWLDRGGLLFNHQVHLAAEGVLNSQRETVHLACSTCHVSEADGAYMGPINYELHCAECHPLRLGGALAELGQLPHETPELVRGTLRERFARLSLEPQAEADLSPSRDGRPLVRLLPKPVQLPAAQQRPADAMLAQADHAVFGLEAKGLCRKCHHVLVRDGAWHVPHVNPLIQAAGAPSAEADSPRMAPDRWLVHGRFHHEKHRTLACAECHEAATSSKTSDVLLPTIATCRKCHGTSAARMGSSVTADCVLCHDYHAPIHPATEGVDLEQLFVP